MIPLKYRKLLPPYWYENDMADSHFSVMDSVMEERIKQINEISNQFILSRATYGLDFWDWIFFRQIQSGTFEERRNAIRKKRRAKARFSIPVLREMAIEYGDLYSIDEVFDKKEIHFRFIFEQPTNVYGLLDEFSRLRPVHVNRAKAILFQIATTSNEIDHLVVQKLKFNVKSNPWGPIGGDREKSPFLDGATTLDGSRFLNGRFSSDGPYHVINLKRNFNVTHNFGSFIEQTSRILDGSGYLTGQKSLEGIIRESVVPVKQEITRTLKTIPVVTIDVSHVEKMKVVVKAKNGVRLLNGFRQLDGTGYLQTEFCKQEATLRIKKNGVVLQEVEI